MIIKKTKCRVKEGKKYECCNAKKGYMCTRIKNHKGKHHAHGFTDCYLIW